MSDVKRTISGEIVAEATKMRHQANEKPSKGSGKDSKLEDAKKELSMVEHQITLPELLTHMGLPADTVTDKTLLKPKGVTQAFGEQRIKEEGANLLTPPPSEPEWKKFMKELFSFFACLLWLGSILCLVNYIIATDMESLEQLLPHPERWNQRKYGRFNNLTGVEFLSPRYTALTTAHRSDTRGAIAGYDPEVLRLIEEAVLPDIEFFGFSRRYMSN